MEQKINPSRLFLKKLCVRDRKNLANKVNVRPEYLYLISRRDRTPSRKLALQLEKHTGGKFKSKHFEDELRVT